MKFGSEVRTYRDVRVIRETATKLLCVVERKEVWISKNLIDDSSEVYQVGTAGKLVVSKHCALSPAPG